MDNRLIDCWCIFFVVIASVINTESIKFGNSYDFHESLFINDGSATKVGCQITGGLKFQLLNKNLYHITLDNPKLFTFSNKISPPEFVPHVSNVDYYNNDPFLVEILSGTVQNVFISREDDRGIVNIKKAISNLLQFQTTNFIGKEQDLNGICAVNYKLNSPNNIIKTKEGCIYSNYFNSSSIWDGNLVSNHKTEIYLSNGQVAEIASLEEHIFTPHLSDVIKANISSIIKIKLTGKEVLEEKFPSEDVKSILNKVQEDLGRILEIHSLQPTTREINCVNCPRFSKIIAENRNYLSDKHLGIINSAAVFLEAVKAARRSSAEDIFNALKAKKNKDILPQLMDILGAAQSINAHQAALKMLKISTGKYDLNLCERYLWALSMSPTVHFDILEDIKLMAMKEYANHKLWDTLILTWTAMVYKYSKIDPSTEKLTEVIEYLSERISECNRNEQCEEILIKALGNIPDEQVLPLLLKLIRSSLDKSGARAMKVLSKFDPKLWNEKVTKSAEKVLLSSSKYDSSSRIFAVDVLLNSKPTYNQLSRIVSVLRYEDKSRELKEYLLQRLADFAELGSSYKNMLKKIFTENGYNNYDILSQDGLSTVFSRSFMTNGSLSTSQEIVGGVLKQGNVNVNLLYNGKIHNHFSLGMFAGGLSSFVSTDEENIVDDEVSTAGLELSVLGVQLRPFVFFNGTGELMGHVWSGTASTLTPAYQALLLLKERTFSIPLEIGENIDVRLESAASADLAGNIEISLWNRNAQSLVKNRAGVILENSFRIDTPYIDLGINFNMSVEPELHLTSDLDFSAGSSLCLQLLQPMIHVNYSIREFQSIPGSRHKLSRTKHIQVPIQGKTYSLNSKNNEMCNKIY